MARKLEFEAALGRVKIRKDVRDYIDEIADDNEVSMAEVVRTFLDVGIATSKAAAEQGVSAEQLLSAVDGALL